MAIQRGAQVGFVLRVVSALLVVLAASTFYPLLTDQAVPIWQRALTCIFLVPWCLLFGFAQSLVARVPGSLQQRQTKGIARHGFHSPTGL